MEDKETLVAVIPNDEPKKEQALSEQVVDIKFRAESIIIQNDEDYSSAGEFGVMLKKKAAEITAFFKPMKDSAYQAHKAVCDREKAMLEPLKTAESIIKKTMGAYWQEKEEKRRREEEEARRLAMAERERLMAEAEKLEGTGDIAAAEEAINEAAIMDSATNYVAPVEKATAKGVSATKDWEIVEIDAERVPIAVAGMEIRPVDNAAVMRLIRMSKGKISIPGIKYREIAKMSFRRG